MNDIFSQAERWAASTDHAPPEDALYCRMKPIFQARLDRMQEALRHVPDLTERYSLIVAVAGEIGNNSFDHNIGNWSDVQGIFFAHDPHKRRIALADRGRGVLTTLRHARPSLKDDAEALHVAFTEVLTGRTPEHRGNGLKFVRRIVTTNPLSLVFQSGNAEARMANAVDLSIQPAKTSIPGCLALLTY